MLKKSKIIIKKKTSKLLKLTEDVCSIEEGDLLIFVRLQDVVLILKYF